MLFACASAFGYVITLMQMPSKITAFFLTLSHNREVILLLINVLQVLGCLMVLTAARRWHGASPSMCGLTKCVCRQVRGSAATSAQPPLRCDAMHASMNAMVCAPSAIVG